MMVSTNMLPWVENPSSGGRLNSELESHAQAPIAKYYYPSPKLLVPVCITDSYENEQMNCCVILPSNSEGCTLVFCVFDSGVVRGRLVCAQVVPRCSQSKSGAPKHLLKQTGHSPSLRSATISKLPSSPQPDRLSNSWSLHKHKRRCHFCAGRFFPSTRTHCPVSTTTTSSLERPATPQQVFRH